MLLTLNIVAPLAYGVSGFMLAKYHTGEHLDVWDKIKLISTTVCVLLQLVSGIYLLTALNIIRKFAKQDPTTGIDVKTMTIHGLSFSLFLIANVVTLVFFFLYEFDQAEKKEHV